MKTQYTLLSNENIKITNAVLGVAMTQNKNGESTSYKIYEKTDGKVDNSGKTSSGGYISAFTVQKNEEILKLFSKGIFKSIMDLNLYADTKKLIEDLEDMRRRAPIHTYQSKITNFTNDPEDPYNLEKCTIETHSSCTGNTVINNAKRDKIELYKTRNYQDLHFIKCSNPWGMPLLIWREKDCRIELFVNDQEKYTISKFNRKTNELISKLTLTEEKEITHIKKYLDTIFTPYSKVTLEIKKPTAYINTKNAICLSLEVVAILLVETAALNIYETTSVLSTEDLDSACDTPELTLPTVIVNKPTKQIASPNDVVKDVSTEDDYMSAVVNNVNYRDDSVFDKQLDDEIPF